MRRTSEISGLPRTTRGVALGESRQRSYWNSGGLGFHVVQNSHAFSRLLKKKDPKEEIVTKNRVVQPRQIHDPGIQ